jgi:hypothetical protein
MTVNEQGRGVIRQGSTPTLQYLLMDEFDAFPREVNIQHTNLPSEWWYRIIAPTNEQTVTETSPDQVGH